MAKKAAKAEIARIEATLKTAPEVAKQLHKTHERDRVTREVFDKAAADTEVFDAVREQARLTQQRAKFQEIDELLAARKKLAVDEHRRHEHWKDLVAGSWLPDVDDEGGINAFLDAWREDQEASMGLIVEPSEVTMKLTSFEEVADHKNKNPRMRFVPEDVRLREGSHILPTLSQRNQRLEYDLKMCVHAVKLTEEIWRAADVALVAGQMKELIKHQRNLQRVYDSIMLSLDMASGTVLQHFEEFSRGEHTEWDTFWKIAPGKGKSTDPYRVAVADGESTEKEFIKLSLTRKNPTNKSTTQQKVEFQEIAISVDKKEGDRNLPDLGLRDHSMRAIQLTFDPFCIAVDPMVGHKYYPLDCVVLLESVKNPDQQKKLGLEWKYQPLSDQPFALTKREYPPQASLGDGTHARSEASYQFKLQFDVPDNICLRAKPQLGKWRPAQRSWDYCNTGDITFDSVNMKKVSFHNKDLAVLALVQEKGYDLPYAYWSVYPLASDEVMVVVQGLERGQPASDREIQIVVRGDKCRLEKPDDKELAGIKTGWHSPATLLRMLSKSGFNLLLNDADAEYLEPPLLPKSVELERKCYHDIARFCTTHAFTSSRHNKAGEDRHCGLFRLSKEQRDMDADEAFEVDKDDFDKWHSVRYDKTRCVLAQFKEVEDEATLANVAGKETQLNLFMLLVDQYKNENLLRARMLDVDPMLQATVAQLLLLIRPLSWG